MTDTLDLHMKSIRHISRLTEEQEAAATREELILTYQPLIVYLSKRMLMRCGRFSPENMMENIQNGNVALIEAIDAYQKGDGRKFCDYATGRIRTAIYEADIASRWIVHVPAGIARLYRSIKRRQASGMTEAEAVKDAKRMSLRTFQGMDSIRAVDAVEPSATHVPDFAHLDAKINRVLTEREAYVIKKVLHEGYMQSEIAEEMEVSTPYINKVYLKAVQKLQLPG